MQLGPWGASKVRGVQPRGPRVMGWVQVTCWCHLAWEAGAGLLWRQEVAGNVGLIGDRRWPWGELSQGWGAGRGGWEGFGEGPGSQEAGTLAGVVARGWG